MIVFTGALEIGGIERSLISLLNHIDMEKYDVDLFLYAHGGQLYREIPETVNVLDQVTSLSVIRQPLSVKLKRGCFTAALARVKAFFTRQGLDSAYADVVEKKAPVLETEYDLAIGFFRPFDFLKTKVDAKVKAGWVHTDYMVEHSARLREDYRGLDKIVAVSEAVRSAFCDVAPEFSDKVCVIENIIDADDIRSKADRDIGITMIHGGIKLLSAGRFCYQKWFDRIPELCKGIRDRGIDIQWYILGSGPDEALIRQKILEFGVKPYVTLLGSRNNPYPYMKECDIYVQPSRYEGKSVCVQEAQVLCKPVAITDYPTAQSQVTDGFDGVILPMDTASCIDALAEFILDPGLRMSIARNLAQKNWDRVEAHKVCALMEP